MRLDVTAAVLSVRVPAYADRMAKKPTAKVVFECVECGAQVPKWEGQCRSCTAWNSLVEFAASESAIERNLPASRPQRIGAVECLSTDFVSTGISELDRVLGGGFASGGVVLIGGEPGVGKSTLLLQALAGVARGGRAALYVTAEESVQQVAVRARRLGFGDSALTLVAEHSVERIREHAVSAGAEIVVVDSVQTVSHASCDSPPGSAAQVRASAAELAVLARATGATVVLVGHVTKDGALAGPRTLEHLVDCVIAFEGDRYQSLRAIRALKNRFGSTSEVGIMEMGGHGLVEVSDPSGVFLADRPAGAVGSVVVPCLEGRRPLLIEIQALLAPRSGAYQRVSVNGLDQRRVEMVLAVLGTHTAVPIAERDVFVAVTGGFRVGEPAADLAISLALVSAWEQRPVPAHAVACGEIGLSGEVRQIGGLARRAAEAHRLGLNVMVCPPTTEIDIDAVDVRQAVTLNAALGAAGLTSGRGSAGSRAHAPGPSGRERREV